MGAVVLRFYAYLRHQTLRSKLSTSTNQNNIRIRTGARNAALRPSLADSIAKREALLTVEELAGLLNLSTRTVHRLTKAGTLPCMRIGVSVRFEPTLIADWLRQRVQSTGGVQ